MKVQVWFAADNPKGGLVIWEQTEKPRYLWPRVMQEAARNRWRIVGYDFFFDLYRIQIEPFPQEGP